MKSSVGSLAADQERDASVSPRPTSAGTSPSTAPVVLLALFEEGHPTATLVRARALCRALGSELHVMRVLPERNFVSALLPQDHAMDMMRTVERTLKVNRSTSEWLTCCLGTEEAARAQFAIAHGNFVDEVAVHAADLGAVLIVIPPREGRMGGTVTSLASTAGVPVLLARESTHDDTIIAATDLESDSYPVLRRAAALGRQLVAPVVAVHNVHPLSVVVGLDMPWPVAVLPGDPVREARSAQLSQICSKRLPVEASAVIRGEMNPVDAILAEACKHNADLVVVGTRRRGWLHRLLAGSVAAKVVNRAKRSVLVTPLDDLGKLADAPAARA